MGLAQQLFKELDISPVNHFEPYSDKDILYIRDNYMTMTDAQIGWKLGRNKFAVRMKRRQLKLDKYKLAIHTGKKVGRQVNRGEVNEEIHALVNFIEVTTSDCWREIANTRRKELLRTIKVEL